VKKFRKLFSIWIWQSQSQKQSGAFFLDMVYNTSKLVLVQKRKMQNDQKKPEPISIHENCSNVCVVYVQCSREMWKNFLLQSVSIVVYWSGADGVVNG